jgi:hypothetical protein
MVAVRTAVTGPAQAAAASRGMGPPTRWIPAVPVATV